MTTQKQCVKYDFVAQLNFYFSSSLLRKTPGSFTLIYFEHEANLSEFLNVYLLLGGGGSRLILEVKFGDENLNVFNYVVFTETALAFTS